MRKSLLLVSSGFLASFDCSVNVKQRILAEPGPGNDGVGAGLLVVVATILVVGVGAAVLVAGAGKGDMTVRWREHRWRAVACLALVGSIGLLATTFYAVAYPRAVALAEDAPSHSGIAELRYTGSNTSAPAVSRWAVVFAGAAAFFGVLSIFAIGLADALASGRRGARSVTLVVVPIVAVLAAAFVTVVYVYDPAPGVYQDGLVGTPRALVVRLPAAPWLPWVMIGVAAMAMAGAWAYLLGDKSR